MIKTPALRVSLPPKEALERGVAWGVRRTEWGLVQKLRDR